MIENYASKGLSTDDLNVMNKAFSEIIDSSHFKKENIEIAIF